MLRRIPPARAPVAHLAPAERRVLARVGMPGLAAAELARRLGWSREALGQRLSALRRRGLGRWADLVAPERRGRPFHVLTWVRLRSLDPASTAAFETRCLEDGSVTQAVVVAGRFDYALWSWHADASEAARWRRLLECRPEVACCESRAVRVIFGHVLDGAPVLAR